MNHGQRPRDQTDKSPAAVRKPHVLAPPPAVAFFEHMGERSPRIQCGFIVRNYHLDDHVQRRQAGYQLLILGVLHELNRQASGYPSFLTQAKAAIARATLPTIRELELLNHRLRFFRSIQEIQTMLVRRKWLPRKEVLAIDPVTQELPLMLARAMRNTTIFYPEPAVKLDLVTDE